MYLDCPVITFHIDMPVMNGLQATKAIRALHGGCSNCPIVAVTGNSEAGLERECASAGMNQVLIGCHCYCYLSLASSITIALVITLLT